MVGWENPTKKKDSWGALIGPFFLRQGPEVVRSSPPGMLCNPIPVPNICESLPFYHVFLFFFEQMGLTLQEAEFMIVTSIS